MGIKNLHKILERHCPHVYKTQHLSAYAYKKVAIDVSLYLYKFKATLGFRWLEGFLNMIICLRKWDIHCFFIFDGVAPIEKREEQIRRRQNLSLQKERVLKLEEEIKIWEDDNSIIGKNMIDIAKKYCPPTRLFKREESVAPLETKIDIEIIKNRLEELKSMIISVTPEDIKISKELFDILKIPHIVAPDEAERYAGHLSFHKKVDAVLSEDTDVLCYQTPLFLSKIDIYKDTVVSLEHADILEGLKMNASTFVDLCIMLGCDYNSNIKNFGMVKSFSLIQQFKTIEDCILEIKKIQPEEDGGLLNYKRCRELFSIPLEVDLYIPYCGSPDFNLLSEFLFQNNLKTKFKKMKENLGPKDVVI